MEEDEEEFPDTNTVTNAPCYVQPQDLAQPTAGPSGKRQVVSKGALQPTAGPSKRNRSMHESGSSDEECEPMFWNTQWFVE